ncbi:metalloregulator ArsR/SmtB family transcription factor [Halalkalibacter sp. APA_J-10(15)]|uniref:helix-turn-helix transcriptional regulator n=1 Tax=unclassified Halalkalibacter TaxID=2893063 RepID=UPI001FF309F2|nr:metalloregulator ArsR/SmtB family transcription factor [Halalkalibacter sp. APA_J-10(15)]MCK0472730.1 transcriptional regulator [Halalkalibacter sp. APA_J-10(15)]
MKKETSTRQLILSILKRNEEQTIADLANKLGITEMAVRRHIKDLEKEEIIESCLKRQTMGRPTYIYSLTEKGKESFPRNYSDLSIGILKDIEQLSGKELVDQVFEKRRDRLFTNYAIEMDGSFKERIEALARIQSENGYMVEYKEVEDGSFEFTEYNCPIAQVAKEYPVACKCEHELFKKLLQTDEVERTSCIAKEGSTSCVYKIKEQRK